MAGLPFPELALQRELGLTSREKVYKQLHFPSAWAKKLRIEKILQGHDGCVNRLAWNAEGTRLASGSDDRQIIIWDYPDNATVPLAIRTSHRANIFGVHFLPCTGDTKVVSGAMDHTVQLHDITRADLAPVYAQGPTSPAGQPIRRAHVSRQLRSVSGKSVVYFCHTNRVKDVEVEPLNPHQFWSAGEDGFVRQFDTRCRNQDNYESPNALLRVRHKGKSIELKSLDICKASPHLLAVAGDDPYLRVYDRRKLQPTSPQWAGGQEPALQLAPPHLPLGGGRHSSRAHATYLQFSNRGDRMVATYHGDHAYCFDVRAAAAAPTAIYPRPPAAPSTSAPTTTQQYNGTAVQQQYNQGRGSMWDRVVDAGLGSSSRSSGNCAEDVSCSSSSSSGSGSSSRQLPRAAEEERCAGNRAVFDKSWTAAIDAFSRALHLAPWCAGLYVRRAESYLGRNWAGDALAALQDCEAALAIDRGGCHQAALRRVRALEALGQLQCASAALEHFMRVFPERSATDEVVRIRHQLQAAVGERRRQREAWLQQRERRRQLREAARRAVQDRRVVQSTPPPRRPQAGGTAASGSTSAAGAAAAVGGSSSAGGAPSRPQRQPPAEDMNGSTHRPDMPPQLDFATAASASATATATQNGRAHAATSAAVMGNGVRSAAGPAAAAAAECSQQDAGGSSSHAQQQQNEQVLGPSREDWEMAERQAGASAADVADATAMSEGSSGAAPCSDDGDSDDDSAGGSDGVDGMVRGSDGDDQEEDEEPSEEEETGSDLPDVEDEEAHALGGGDEVDESEEEQEEGDDDDDHEEAGGGASSSGMSDLEEGAAGGGSDEDDPCWEPFLGYYGHNGPAYGGSGPGTTRPGVLRGYGSRSGKGGDQVPCPALAPHVRQRFVGHCNMQTDIKESTFVGQGDKLVACGSDDGRVFLYEADSGAIVRVLEADEDIVNCMQCHPHLPVLATSGIESVVRLWSPLGVDVPQVSAAQQDSIADLVGRNQDRIREGPHVLRASALHALADNPHVYSLLLSQLYGRAEAPGAAAPAGADDDEEDQRAEVSCRVH